MAITITSAPNGLIPKIVGQPIVYEFTSNSVDIQYCIVEILYNGVRVSARSVQPNLGTTDEFSVNTSEDVEMQLFFELKAIGSSGVITDSTNQGETKIKVYEVDLNPTTGLLETDYDPDDANNSNYDYQSGDLIVCNWKESHFDLNNFDIEDYRLTADTKLFLTNSPYKKNIELGSDEFIGILFHSSAPTQNFRLQIFTYDASDALLNTDFINVTDWDIPYGVKPENPYLDIAVGTQNLINEGISLTNVAYYTIQMINNSGDVSEVKRFNIVEACDYDTRVHWVNKYGKQDSYTFKGNKSESLDTAASVYQKALPQTYNSSDRGFGVIQNISTRNFTAYTNTIGKDEYNFISTMLFNKMAWVEIEDSYYPIIIEDGTTFIRDERNIPTQFVLNYSFANKDKGIRG
jgi:hypothetical protein